MPKPLVWVKIKTSEGGPTARMGHTLVEMDKDLYIMYGGLDAHSKLEGNIVPNGHVFTLRVSQKGEYVWTQTDCEGDEIPLARTNHGACKIGKNEMFVFGGYYTSKKRFNDVHILKIVLGRKYQWIQPANQKLGKATPKNTESKIGAPEPRANHTCTFVERQKKVYVFGGQGGVGYSRKSFNDIYSYDCTTQWWTKITPKSGTAPKERGGHTACLLPDEKSILIYGGWSGTTQHYNCFIFDTEKEDWIDLEFQKEEPRWNHSAVVVPCLPKSKLFAFGGERADYEEGAPRQFGTLDNSVSYLEIGTTQEMKDKKFNNVTITEQKPEEMPLPRENTVMIYDRIDQRLIIFGGWSGNYLNDIWELNISSITGPDYSISDLHPKLGPVTGGTQIEISGDGFVGNKSFKVCFYTGRPNRHSIDVAAKLITVPEHPPKLICETPNFAEFGKGDYEVRISADRGDPTLDACKFTFFPNISPKFTVCYGPGILGFNSTKGPTSFYIQAKNKANENRTSGKDLIDVKICYEYVEEVVNPDKQEKEKKVVVAEVPVTEIKDFDNGLYQVTYTMPEEIPVKIEVKTKGDDNQLALVRGAPYKAEFSHAIPEEANNFYGKKMMEHLKQRLDGIQQFYESTHKEIYSADKPPNSEQPAGYEIESGIKALLVIKENIVKVKGEKDAKLLELEVMKQAFSNFKTNNNTMGHEHDQAHKLIHDIEKLAEKAEKTEGVIQPFMAKQREKVKVDIETFDKTLKDFLIKLKKKSIYEFSTGYELALPEIAELEEHVKKFDLEYKDFAHFSKMLYEDEEPANLPSSAKTLEIITEEVKAMKQMWLHIEKCEKHFLEYLNLEWKEIDTILIADDIKNKMTKPLSNIKKIDKKNNNTFKDFSRKLKNWETFIGLIGELKKASMVVEDNRHWDDVRSTFETDIDPEDSPKLELFWNLEIFDPKSKEAIEEISLKADQEGKIEKQLKEVSKKWKAVTFDRVPLQLKEVKLETLKMKDEDTEKLEQDQLLIQTISASKYMAHFEEEVVYWQRGLTSINDTVSLLSEVQKTWSFLINLFRFSEEVKNELKNETKDFAKIDREVEDLLKNSARFENILEFCIQDYEEETVLAKLTTIAHELAKCQKGLNNFIAEKRKVFPRFYFLTMEELLDILANGNNPIMLFKEKNYMSKIVQAADKLSMKEEGERPTIVSMNASVGKETVTFVNHPKSTLKGKVEIYLQDILEVVLATMKDTAKKTWKEFAAGIITDIAKMGERASNAKVNWIKTSLAQNILLISSTGWVLQTEERFRRIQEKEPDAMKSFLESVIANLTSLIKLVQGDLESPVRRKVMCLITMETHNRDIIDRLVTSDVRKADDFQWQSQLKFYYDEKTETFYTRIADAMLWYGYEYLGNGARLVVTPLTDRIYVTATQALHLKMGCAPAGPAGTGKTETTKDLANAVGKACYVFNCSPEMNYESMGNIFKGLASSGCWGCFDEFNRLVPEVLSVCTVQFKAVTDAIKAAKTTFFMGDDEIKLDPTCGAFITMNPGYLGRSELPEGLKALFRPITVVVPDLELICENILMAEGFVEAKKLARKFVTLYNLCRDLLSKQDHYDWGLRAIKSVLVVAGTFKRAESEIKEDSLLFRALRDFNYPKIAQVDLGIFDGLLSDLFPGINIERKVNEKFERVITEVSRSSELKDDPNFILKVVQLGELLEIRHCVFIMGNPGSGKTTTWKMLAKANTQDGNKTIAQDLDPKVVSTQDFYGYTNLTTKEWKNGLFSHYMQYFSEETVDGKPKWVILDGDLDANWIESMNSVMDDNKLLTLANNARIVVKDYMRLIFEIRDLKFATPATVSRAGILYISDDSGYQRKCYIDSWLRKMQYEESMTAGILEMTEKYVEKTVLFLLKKCKFVTPVSYFGMTVAFCKLLQSQVKIHLKYLYPTEEQNKGKAPVNLVKLEHIVTFAVVWALGGSLTQKDNRDYRKEFSDWWKGEFSKPVKFKSKGTIFDYYVKIDESKADFEEWRSFMVKPAGDGEGKPEEKKPAVDKNSANNLQTPNPFESVTAFVDYDGTIPMQNITVPIPETISIKLITKSLIYEGHPTLMIGNAGSGKTQLIKGILKEVRAASKAPHEYYYLSINFNYYTDANSLQTMLEQDLVKQGTTYGPKKGSQIKLIYFIDDLNMPKLDPYNTQSAIALLRQHLDHSHWYDITKQIPILKEIRNTQVIAAMNPTSGSFFVNPRYQRHFWTCAVSFPESSSLTIIYETFLRGHFSKFKASIQEMTPQLIKAAIALHEKVSSQFKKTAVNFHYEFNFRHISNIFAGILQTQPHNFPDAEKIIKLWFHESERIYADRLIEAVHIKGYTESALEIVKKIFAKNVVQRHYQGDAPDPLIFCHFPQGYQNDKVYDISPFNEVKKNVEGALEDHNEEKVKMNLVLFEDAVKHVCRISRIISNTAGHALLVGVGGSGKQSLSKLSAYIKYYSVFSITVSKEYSVNDLKTDLIELYNKTGVKDDPFMFLLTDSHITNEKFLVSINDLLSSGEISDLYTEDDKSNIINLVRAKCKSEGKGDTNDEIYQYFIDKVRENLHVVLCFSPIGDTFRTRARRFPALVNSTVIDWFQNWPESALESVADQKLKEAEIEDEEVRKAIVKFMPESFKVVNKAALQVYEKERRFIYNTPKSFLELIGLYCSMLKEKKKTLEDDKYNYEKGLSKLVKTKTEVNELEANLKENQKVVDSKKAEADKVAEVVGAEKLIVEEENRKAKEKRDICTKIKAQVEKQQKSCQEDVDRLQPMVDTALARVKNINPDDIKMVRGFNSPPPGIDKVFNCIQYLFAGVPTYTEGIELTKQKLPKNLDWASIKKEILSKADVLIKNLQRFPNEVAAGNVPEQNFKEISKYLADPNFNEKSILQKSSAAASMFVFVQNMVAYYEAMREMIPKQNMLKEAQVTLEDKVKELQEVEELVADLNAKLAIKQRELDAATAEKESAQALADACNKKLSLARRLVSALDSEEKRWGTSIEDLTQKLGVLAGDILISAAFISYAGPFSKLFRHQIIQGDFKNFATKKNIPMSANFSPVSLLTNEAEIAEWNNEGLPADEVSIENGTILRYSARYPLMIDPQLQGITWIKERLKNSNPVILKLSKKNYAYELERAIEDGNPVIIENLGAYIDPVLMPVIARNIIYKGSKAFMIFGGKQLDLNDNFRLYMQTKLSNPAYPPEIQAEAVLINFTVTEVGLGDQLLNFIVGKERPDLASTKKELILQQNKFKIQLKELERGLLDKLNKTVGDATENIELIEGLENSKLLATEIKEKVEKAIETTKMINETSEFYRPSATRGALIFFLMNDLYKMSSFYMYSLESFINVIDRSVDFVARKYRAEKTKGHAVAAGSNPPVDGAKEVEPKDGEAKDGDKKEADKKEGDAKEPKPADSAPETNRSQDPKAANPVAPPAEDEPLTPRSLRKRVAELTESITYHAYSFVRRGLFERHKLIFCTMLCFKILISTKELRLEDYNNFIITKKPPNVNYPENDTLKAYITEAQYKECKGLEYIDKYQGLCDTFISEHLNWKKWIGTEKAEDEELPSKLLTGVSPFQKLMLIKILRPDRVSYALKAFLLKSIGERYIEQPAFDMQEVYDESNEQSPIFFVLFPGVDPTPAVEELGQKYGITAGKGFMNLSMGQGQEDLAKNEIIKAANEGTWIFLQNVHLMQAWLKDLELRLEEVCPTANKKFRMFISSEPPPLLDPTMPIIPEAILQRCIKVANEAPADLKANMRRAYAKFSQERIAKSSKPVEYKSILFALCYFHSVVSGRKKFGSQGWSRIYNFNDGDLLICADVLHNYLEKYDVVPYNDLIYIYGEIMYGGHITDNWDRRTNITYLKKLIRKDLMDIDNFNLIPIGTGANSGGSAKIFRMIDPVKNNYDEYKHYLEKLPEENPMMFGMHPNAEINFLLNQTEFIFKTVIDLIGEAGGSGGKSDAALKETVIRLRKEIEPNSYDLIDLRDRIATQNKGEPPLPFQIVCQQECERMNQLILVMVTTLVELELGLDGALNMTDAMDQLSKDINLNRVAPAWGAFYMSKKPLDSWFADLKRRCDQLRDWSLTLVLPRPLRLSYLFNPMSFLTAIMQITARENGLPLDNMALVTKVTNFKDVNELIASEKKPVTDKKKEEEEEDPTKKKDEGGAYVDGFFLEGADWEAGGSGEGSLCDQKPKILHPNLPIIKVISVPIEKKDMKGQYPCPVYYTTMRGPTYIFTANLRMESQDQTDEPWEEWKWILAGVAAILNDDN